VSITIPEYQLQRQCGVRIFTLYFYLNDVEEGGGTNFPSLNLTVTPKRGRAALWPSVYDHDPNLKDPRTEHAALPVTKGVKYGANAWLHQRDFKNPHREGCN
jgi:prolyl 4-hydroxylase